MGTIPLLAPNSIIGIHYIGGAQYRAVYRVITAAGEMVIKAEKTGEKDASASLKWGSKLMKNVSSADVNVKILSQNEIGEFHRAATALLPNDPDLFGFFTSQIVWVKMPLIQDLSDSDLWQKNLGDVVALYNKMNKPNFWVQLGQILAVDIFIGNIDRFALDGTPMNEGNIFFRDAGNGGHDTIGLDFFSVRDLANGDSNLVKFKTTSDEGTFDYLYTLTQDGRMTGYATNVVHGLNAHLNKRNRKNAAGNAIRADLALDCAFYTGKLKEGIVLGATAIRSYLRGKIATYGAMPAPAPPAAGWKRAVPQPPPIPSNNKPVAKHKIPPGIISRMQFLGWLN